MKANTIGILCVLAGLLLPPRAATATMRDHPLQWLMRQECVCLFVPGSVHEDGSATGACEHAASTTCPDGDFVLHFRPIRELENRRCARNRFLAHTPVVVGLVPTESGRFTGRCMLLELLPSDEGSDVIEAFRASRTRGEAQVFEVIEKTTSPTALWFSVWSLVLRGSKLVEIPDAVVDRLEGLLRHPEVFRCELRDCMMRSEVGAAQAILQLLVGRSEEQALLRLVRDLPSLEPRGDAYLEMLASGIRSACHLGARPEGKDVSTYLHELASHLDGLGDGAVDCAALRTR